MLAGLHITQEVLAKPISDNIKTVFPTPTAPPFENYPQFIQDFLESGGDLTTLENLLQNWQNITDELGGIEFRDSSEGQLIIVHVFRPMKDDETLSDRLMIFLLKDQKVQGIFDSNELVRGGYIFDLMPDQVITPNRLPDIAFSDRFCGAHTCYDALYIVEWDGQSFVLRLNGELEMPYPHYLIDVGQITAVSGHEGSVGAGAGRAYTEIWQWNGSVFTATEKIIGPPTVRMHLIYDADTAFEQGDLTKAMTLYQQAIDDKSLSSQTFYYTDEDAGAKVISAYANFKLILTYATQGQIDKAKEHYEHLIANNPPETPGYLSVRLGQAFWDNYLRTNNLELACAAAIVVAEADSKITEQLYVGYAFTNRIYKAADICRLSVSGNY
jgi:tetratricopeptide (TPR) repeat protein